MAFRQVDLAWETTTTTGTGAYTLAGAVSGFVTLNAAGVANGDTVAAFVYDGAGGTEAGIYTWGTGGILTRTAILRSSNADAAVSWGAGVKNVVVTPLAVLFESFLTPGSTGIPVRTDDKTWAYKAMTGSGAVALQTNPLFFSSWSLGTSSIDARWEIESAGVVGVYTPASVLHTTGNGLIEKWYTYWTDASNYEGWQHSAAVGSGDFEVKHIRVGTYAGATRSYRIVSDDRIVLNADGGVELSQGLTAGTTSFSPLVFRSGTNLTTPAAGSWEYDGGVAYFTPNGTNRGVVQAANFILNNNNTYTLISQTAAQKAFNSPTNGQLTLPVGLFEFEGYFELSSLSATSGSFGFALAGTATKTQYWTSTAIKTAAGAAGAAALTTHNTSNANTTLCTANTTTSGWFMVKGTMRITVAGTVIPQISLGVAAAAVVGALSYFKVRQIGDGSVRSIGAWT